MEFAAIQMGLLGLGVIGGLVGLIWGISTSGQDYPNAFLDRQFGMATATPARRMGGALLDGLIMLFTLFIGWLIWFIIVAPRGQTPGKALVSTYVMREDGRVAGGWFMWGREALIKWLMFAFIDAFAYGFAKTIASLWCLWDDDKQCVWDKMMTSYVAYSPYGAPRVAGQEAVAGVTSPDSRLRELQQLRADGIITAEEYEERRQRLTSQP